MVRFFKTISACLAIIMGFVSVFGIIKEMTQPSLPERGIVQKDDDALRVMTFNVRTDSLTDTGENSSKVRRPLVPQLIGEYLPDSVGVQECTYKWYKGLKKYLPEYDIVGVGRDNGKRNLMCGEMSAILYLKDKYTLIDSGTFWLSETPEKVSRGWDGACNRICTYAVLQNKQTGEKYAHVNTHLDHKGNDARTNGLSLVTQKALSFDIPCVVTGDMNFRENDALYEQMTIDLLDTKYIAEKTMSGFTFHGFNPQNITNNSPIDYICVNNKIKSVREYKIIEDRVNGILPSDHYPIYADIIL